MRLVSFDQGALSWIDDRAQNQHMHLKWQRSSRVKYRFWLKNKTKLLLQSSYGKFVARADGATPISSASSQEGFKKKMVRRKIEAKM